MNGYECMLLFWNNLPIIFQTFDKKSESVLHSSCGICPLQTNVSHSFLIQTHNMRGSEVMVSDSRGVKFTEEERQIHDTRLNEFLLEGLGTFIKSG